MARLGMSLEPRLSQLCELCQQEILSGRQFPINALSIEGYAMCPQCRQPVSAAKQRDKNYLREWERFRNGLKLDL
jgi:predicted amidophosphoribosyltransferase